MRPSARSIFPKPWYLDDLQSGSFAPHQMVRGFAPYQTVQGFAAALQKGVPGEPGSAECVPFTLCGSQSDEHAVLVNTRC
jgi:hypothetical protein